VDDGRGPSERGQMIEASPAVVRREWGKQLHDLRPLHAERMQLTKIGPLSDPPADPKGFTEYGFDAEQRLVEVRAHRGKGRTDVERYRFGTNTIDVEHEHSTPNVPITHSRYSLVDGRIVAWRWQTLAGLVEETYSYEGDLVATMRTLGPNDPPRIFRCEWGPAGLLRISVEKEGTGRVVEVFRAAAPSTVDEIAALETLLFETIVERVGNFAIDGAAYALLLVEGEGYDAVPPELAIGLERERDDWLAGGAQNLRERLWSPEDLSLFDDRSHLDGEPIQTKARALRESLRASNRPEETHRLNVRVAKRLNDDSARLVLPKTDDFVVLVVGLDSGVQRSELDSYVPPAKLEALRSSGWI